MYKESNIVENQMEFSEIEEQENEEASEEDWFY